MMVMMMSLSPTLTSTGFPGEYEVMYVSHETRFIHGRKLIITFRITDREMADARVMSYYNVMSFLSDPGVGGRFKVGRCSKFFREFTRLFEPDTPRLDRLPMSRFRHQPILVVFEKSVP